MLSLIHADSDDIKDVDLTPIHYLSGPIAVDGAKQGDCLVVDILDGARLGFFHDPGIRCFSSRRHSSSSRRYAVGLHSEFTSVIRSLA